MDGPRGHPGHHGHRPRLPHHGHGHGRGMGPPMRFDIRPRGMGPHMRGPRPGMPPPGMRMGPPRPGMPPPIRGFGPRGPPPFRGGPDHPRPGGPFRGNFGGPHAHPRPPFGPPSNPVGPGPHPVPTIESRGPQNNRNGDGRSGFVHKNQGDNFQQNNRNNKGFVPKGKRLNNHSRGKEFRQNHAMPVNSGSRYDSDDRDDGGSPPDGSPNRKSNQIDGSQPQSIPTMERSNVTVIGGNKRDAPSRQFQHHKRQRRDYQPNNRYQNYNHQPLSQNQMHQHPPLHQPPPSIDQQPQSHNGYNNSDLSGYQIYDTPPPVSDSYSSPQPQYSQSSYGNSGMYDTNAVAYGSSQSVPAYTPQTSYPPPQTSAPVGHASYDMSDYRNSYQSVESVDSSAYSVPPVAYENSTQYSVTPQYATSHGYQQPPPSQQTYSAYEAQGAPVGYAARPEYDTQPPVYY